MIEELQLDCLKTCCDLLMFLGRKLNEQYKKLLLLQCYYGFLLTFHHLFHSYDLPAGCDLRGSMVVCSQVALWSPSSEAERLCMWRPSVSSAAAVVFRTSASACRKFWFDVCRAFLQRQGKVRPSRQSVGEIHDACILFVLSLQTKKKSF